MKIEVLKYQDVEGVQGMTIYEVLDAPDISDVTPEVLEFWRRMGGSVVEVEQEAECKDE